MKDFDKLSREEIAKVFRRTPRTIQNWFTRSGFPRNADKSYSAFDCLNWAIEKAKQGEPAGQESLESQKWLAEFRRHRAALAQLDLKEREGSLISRQQSIDWLVSLITEAKHAFLWLPRRLAPALASITEPRKIESLLKDEIYSVLRKLARPTTKKDKKQSQGHVKA